MKSTISNLIPAIIICFLVTGSLFSQTTYENEWINHSLKYYKFTVDDDGLVQIPFQTLSTLDLPLNGGAYRLYSRGEEVPIHVSTSGTMGANDFIEFIGKKNDGYFDTQMYEAAHHQPIPELSLFYQEGTYYLTSDNSGTALRATSHPNNFTAGMVPEPNFFHTEKTLFRSAHNQGKPNHSLGSINNFTSDMEEGEGFSSTIYGGLLENINGFTFQENITLDFIDFNSADDEAICETKIMGANNNFFVFGDHHLKLRINNTEFVDDTFEGYSSNDYEFEVPIDILSPSTSFSLEGINDNGSADLSRYTISYINLSYPRLFNFANEQNFNFYLDNDGDKYLEIENFDGGSVPILYDLTENRRYQPVLQSGVYKVFIPQLGSENKREFFISSTTNLNAVQTVSNTSVVNFVDFSDPTIAADYITIYHSTLTAGNENHVEEYATYRRSAAGGNHEVLTVDIDQLYDQFGHGIQKHPLAVRNFCNYIIDQGASGNWNTNPEYLFLVGRSFVYSKASSQDSEFFEGNLIPTYGHKGSDNILSSRGIGDYRFQLSTGRISVTQPEQIKAYLDKVIEYEALINDPPCDKASRLWMKHLVQIGAGNSAAESAAIGALLDGYKTTTEDSLSGNKVILNFSSETDQVSPLPEDIVELIEAGLSNVTFFGHSSGTELSVDLPPVQFIENKGRYPLFISLSCFIGNVHEENFNLPTEWTLTADKGSIGFLASVGIGFPIFLDFFTAAFFRNMSIHNYGASFATCVRESVNDIYNPDQFGTKLTAHEMTLQGDPAVEPYHFNAPEFLIEEDDIFFEPEVISEAVEFFDVNLIITNGGKADVDSIEVLVERTLPNGDTEVAFEGNVVAPLYRDTISLTLQNSVTTNFGLSTFEVSIDPDNLVEEDCEMNNTVVKELLVLPSSAIPIEPCAYDIVSDPAITLKASTAVSILSSPASFIMQIDVTPNFNSPALLETEVSQLGGVIEWTPSLTYQNGETYFWRIGNANGNTNDASWQSSSFTFDSASDKGWCQSHPSQLAENTYRDGMTIGTSGVLDFGPTLNTIKLINGWAPLNPLMTISDLGYFLNGNRLVTETCLKLSDTNCQGGIAFAVFKPESILEPWLSVKEQPTYIDECQNQGQFGENHCGSGAFSTKEIFEFYTGDIPAWVGPNPPALNHKWQNMENFLDAIPDGHYVLAYSILDHRFGTPNPNYAPYQNNVIAKLEGMGATGLSSIGQLQHSNGNSYDAPFIFFTRKGDPDYDAHFEIAGSISQVLSLDRQVNGKQNQGSYETNLIGPAKNWDRLEYEITSNDPVPNDEDFDIEVYGYDNNFTETFLLNTGDITNTDLSTIDADQFPYLKLIAVNRDTNNFTPPQLQRWKVFMDRAGELAVNQNVFFDFKADTLRQGEDLEFEIALTNASPCIFDSITVNYSLITPNNQTVLLPTPKMEPLDAYETANAKMTWPSQNLIGGQYSLQVNINPDREQIEKFNFNNILLFPFFVINDAINPLVDVTFDGTHILNGDIVSASPQIEVTVVDENAQIALSDTSIVDLFLQYPNGMEERVEHSEINFIPANVTDLPNSNEAKFILEKDFLESGIHRLKVQGRDMAGNESGSFDYDVEFEVILESTASNLLNYPNPFTSSTQFVFTLTGKKFPDVFKIQIMSVSGKVVREIDKSELGNVHIGRNITDFAWDGKDTYGNELANGVYFYRVVVSDEDGTDWDKYSNVRTQNLDKLFGKYGIGKMYKVR